MPINFSLNTEEHGGGCCGIRHISGFDNVTAGSAVTALASAIANCMHHYDAYYEDGKVAKGMLEIVIIDEQAIREIDVDGRKMRWHDYLLSTGWQRVTRFQNSNSSNYCNVYHLSFGQPRGRNRKADPLK